MPIGLVQFFLESKGYGYIRHQHSREEFYVKRKDLLTPIQRGDLVSFSIEEDNQGLFAVAVKKLPNTSPEKKT